MIYCKGFKTGSADELANEIQNFCQSENITNNEIKSCQYNVSTDGTYTALLIYIQI